MPHSLRKPPCHAPDGGDTGYQTCPLWGAEGKLLGQSEQLSDPSQGQAGPKGEQTVSHPHSAVQQAPPSPQAGWGHPQALPALEEAERGHDL